MGKKVVIVKIGEMEVAKKTVTKVKYILSFLEEYFTFIIAFF